MIVACKKNVKQFNSDRERTEQTETKNKELSNKRNTNMGAVQSSAKAKADIKTQMEAYEQQWESRPFVSSQTEVFRRIVPTKAVDFTDTFKTEHLDQFFTHPKKLRTGEGFNCNHLFRFSREEIRIPVYSTSKYMVTQPLGEPGRDLGDNNGDKVSHLMVITQSTSGPITFNEMLPSTDVEVEDLGERLEVLNKAYDELAKNSPVSACGEKVKECADKHGISHDTGIREFLGHVIHTLTEEERTGQPGYVLKNEANDDIAVNHAAVQALITRTFTQRDKKVGTFIQGPDNNSQILSHIHGFLLPKSGALPKEISENYIPADVIFEIKKEKAANPPMKNMDMGPPLARQTSVMAR